MCGTITVFQLVNDWKSESFLRRVTFLLGLNDLDFLEYSKLFPISNRAAAIEVSGEQLVGFKNYLSLE